MGKNNRIKKKKAPPRTDNIDGIFKHMNSKLDGVTSTDKVFTAVDMEMMYKPVTAVNSQMVMLLMITTLHVFYGWSIEQCEELMEKASKISTWASGDRFKYTSLKQYVLEEGYETISDFNLVDKFEL